MIERQGKVKGNPAIPRTEYNHAMLLAGDIGGTKALLGLFEARERRPAPIATDQFTTLEYDGFEAMLDRFLRARGIAPEAIEAASFGVAGAVTSQVAQLTNVPWCIDAAALASRARLRRVRLLNDLEAMAYGVPVLAGDELAVLQEGVRVPTGNIAVIAAGTGLGEGMLLNIEGRLVPGQSEGGHADFSARTPRELEMVGALSKVLGRVSAEHILSGPGLVNIYRFTHDALGQKRDVRGADAAHPQQGHVQAACAAVGEVTDAADMPPRITAAALARTCERCVETLDLFVSAYGAEAGNMGLRVVATAGVYVGGGIAPKILPALRSGLFMEAFAAKAPLDHLVGKMPVAVILNKQSGLLGAAVHANGNRA
jgi:glucokinase